MTFTQVLKQHPFMYNIKIVYFDIDKQPVDEYWFRLNRRYTNQGWKYPPKCICFNHFIVERYGKKFLICNCYHPSVDAAALNEKEQQTYCDAVSSSAWSSLEAYNESFGKQYNMFGGMD